MKLHELKPAEGSKRARRRVGRGIGSGMGNSLPAEPKGRMQEPVAASVQDLKAARCPCIADSQNAASRMFLLINMLLLT